MTPKISQTTYRLPIPFQGFGYSIHDAAFDDAILSLEEGGEDVDEVDFAAVRQTYSVHYAKAVGEVIGLPLTFGEMIPSQDYASRTDRIFADVPGGALRELRRAVMGDADRKEAFAALVADLLAARDGFAPFYSDDLEDWGSLIRWEPPQCGLLIDFRVQEAGFDEAGFAERMSERLPEMILSNRRETAPTMEA